MFLVSFTKGPGSFPYVFIITGWAATVIPIYSVALVRHRVFVLGGNQETPDGTATLEVGLNAIPTTDPFDTFTKTLCVGYDNVTLEFNFMGVSVVPRCDLVVNPINSLTGGPVEPSFHIVQSPFGVVTLGESLLKMVHFFLEQLRIAAHCFGPMGKGVNDTKCGYEVMVASHCKYWSV